VFTETNRGEKHVEQGASPEDVEPNHTEEHIEKKTPAETKPTQEQCEQRASTGSKQTGEEVGRRASTEAGEINYAEPLDKQKSSSGGGGITNHADKVESTASAEGGEVKQTKEGVENRISIEGGESNLIDKQVEKKISHEVGEVNPTKTQDERKASTEHVQITQTEIHVGNEASDEVGHIIQTREQVEPPASTASGEWRPFVNKIFTSSAPILVPLTKLETRWRTRGPVDRIRDKIQILQDMVGEGEAQKENMNEDRGEIWSLSSNGGSAGQRTSNEVGSGSWNYGAQTRMDMSGCAGRTDQSSTS
jgi:hypothetical protein